MNFHFRMGDVMGRIYPTRRTSATPTRENKQDTEIGGNSGALRRLRLKVTPATRIYRDQLFSPPIDQSYDTPE
jgi:hypothetical protein